MDKERYNALEMEMIGFAEEDVIVTSGPEGPVNCEFNTPITH